MATGNELLDLIRARGADRFRDVLWRHARRSIRITSHAPSDKQVVGTSRIGGLPDLPDGVQWPRMDVVDTPLAFLAQINLSETGLPKPDGASPHAMLYFFADPEEPFGFGPADREHWQVIYSAEAPSAGPSAPPEDLAPESIFKSAAVSFATEWTLPPLESPMMEGLGMTEEEVDTYLEGGGEETVHRLFGHPDQIQGFVPYEVALASSGLMGSWDTPEAKAAMARYDEWILLFQLDSDWETHGMMWGDAGRLYFYIRKEDLTAMRFDRVWLTMQCG